MLMSKVTKNSAVPKLRFPEFRGDGNWKQKVLNQIATAINVRAQKVDSSEILTLSAEYGVIKQGDYFGRKLAGENVERHIKILRNDFVYNDRTTKAFAYGTIKRLSKYSEGIVSPIYKCFRFNDDENPVFWDWYFDSGSHESQLHDVVNEGARAGRFNISTEKFLSITVREPSTLEQQKIADCLSSLDDLITAENKKLEALHAHKKGLMQQMFPAEGEAVPKLRFKEFAKSGEWEETTLGALGELISGLTYKPEDVRENGLLVLRSSNVQNGEIVLEDCVYVDPDVKGANLSKANDILICVRNGSKSLIGKNAIIPQGLPPSTHGAFMTVFRAYNPKFAYQLFQSDSYNQQVSNDLGATINSINGSNLIKYKFYVPKLDEQQKIADCLSSLDKLIAAQAEKVINLKEHKKGLMQGLFPVINN